MLPPRHPSVHLISIRRAGKCLNLQQEAPTMNHRIMNLSVISSFSNLQLDGVQSVDISGLQNIPLDVDYLEMHSDSNPHLTTHDII